MKKYTYIIVVIFGMFPDYVLAAPPRTFKQLVDMITGLIMNLVPMAAAVALLVFLWGIAEFIRNAENSVERDGGKQKMLWGVIGLFVLFSLWGLVAFLGTSVGISL